MEYSYEISMHDTDNNNRKNKLSKQIRQKFVISEQIYCLNYGKLVLSIQQFNAVFSSWNFCFSIKYSLKIAKMSFFTKWVTSVAYASFQGAQQKTSELNKLSRWQKFDCM